MSLKYLLSKAINLKTSYLLVIIFISIFLVLGCFSYAVFTSSSERSGALNIVTGNLYSLIESKDLENNKIVVEANSSRQINLKIVNANSIDAKFNLYYLSNQDVSVQADNIIPKEGIIIPKSTSSSNYVALSVIVSNSLDVSATVTFGSDVGLVNSDLIFPSDRKELVFSPSKPELVGDMIPIVYDDSSSSWIKADINNENMSWYNYDKQVWANAITVVKEKREFYSSSPIGTPINITDINTMFVWIPRYSYLISNNNIGIKWISKEITNTTDNTSLNYYTPSAFCFGNTCDTSRDDKENRELSGVWISKYEISNKEQLPIINPNIPSWTNANVSTLFTSVLNNMNGNNGEEYYGFTGTSYNTHLIKNTEWGIVAYLSESKYGKSSGNIEESTTRNISGIYNMKDNKEEYVMANMKSSKEIITPEKKYLNIYNYGDNPLDYSRSMLGDAITETLSFNNSEANFLNNDLRWLVRGKNNIFSFNATSGEENFSSRIALIP